MLIVRRPRLRCALALVMTSLSAPALAQTVDLRVDGDHGGAPPGSDGSGWGASAFEFLQDALTKADDLLLDQDATLVRIWVAATDPGNPYLPGECATCDPEWSRLATFLMHDHVELYGGFAGSETSLSQRDPDANVTVLSGNHRGPCLPEAGGCFQANATPGCDDSCQTSGDCPGCCQAVCMTHPFCCIVEWEQDCADFAEEICLSPPLDIAGVFHVVTADGVDVSARLDGFTITGGLANEGTPGTDNTKGKGGGMLIINASPAVLRCTFTENAAPGHGGGAMAIEENSDPSVSNVIFKDNSGHEAGAMHSEGNNAGGTFVNCLFIGNTSVDEGGALNPGGAGGVVALINCTFFENRNVSMRMRQLCEDSFS